MLLHCVLRTLSLTDTHVGVQEAARKAWWLPGHPGWCIPWNYDSTAFMRSLTENPNVAQPAPSPKMRISAPVPRSLQTSKCFRAIKGQRCCSKHLRACCPCPQTSLAITFCVSTLHTPCQWCMHTTLYVSCSLVSDFLTISAGGLLQHLGNPLGVSLPHSLASSDTHLDRGFRSSSATAGPSNPLAHISAAQLLPNFQSLYTSNPGAMLGSGQAAHQALGSQTQSSLTANLNAGSTQTQRYLAGLGMGQVRSHVHMDASPQH